jgi:hypothetical protein
MAHVWFSDHHLGHGGGVILATAMTVLLLALRLAGGRVGRAVVAGWVSLFRNTPLLVQLLFWYFAAWNVLPLAFRQYVNDDHAFSILPGDVWWFTRNFSLRPGRWGYSPRRFWLKRSGRIARRAAWANRSRKIAGL